MYIGTRNRAYGQTSSMILAAMWAFVEGKNVMITTIHRNELDRVERIAKQIAYSLEINIQKGTSFSKSLMLVDSYGEVVSKLYLVPPASVPDKIRGLKGWELFIDTCQLSPVEIFNMQTDRLGMGFYEVMTQRGYKMEMHEKGWCKVTI